MYLNADKLKYFEIIIIFYFCVISSKANFNLFNIINLKIDQYRV